MKECSASLQVPDGGMSLLNLTAVKSSLHVQNQHSRQETYYYTSESMQGLFSAFREFACYGTFRIQYLLHVKLAQDSATLICTVFRLAHIDNLGSYCS